MDILEKHLSKWDINQMESYSSSKFMREFVTCVKPTSELNATWTCIDGAYERYCEEDPAYEYKVMNVPKIPNMWKKHIFESMNNGHTLYLSKTIKK